MQASETKLQPIIEGTKQYVVPLFQRAYSWDKKEWNMLWDDIIDLCESDNARNHFIGSLVTMPTTSVPEGVSKYLLIDGQQRITTIFIILTLLRNKAKENGQVELADEINNTLLVNPYKKHTDYFKLQPTQSDRGAFYNLIKSKNVKYSNRITQAYQFFERKFIRTGLSIELIKKVITNNISVVSIVLNHTDNPHLVFESLNAKGLPLSQSDLIRNYFFMLIHIDKQEDIYRIYWKPMQDSLENNLTEFIRHFLMKDGIIIKQNDVYFSLKENVNQDNAIDYLKQLYRYSINYKKLLEPPEEPNKILSKYLSRLNRLEITTAYPFLLNCYNDYSQQRLSCNEFVEVLRILENFLIRRFVCLVPTNQLNKIFPVLYNQVLKKQTGSFIDRLKNNLQTKGYPKDIQFKARLMDAKLYGSGDRAIKTKLILESIEESFNHKEQVLFDTLSIEHVMPQTLTESWQNYLGEEWEVTHELLLHTIGNLTLTAYNPELSNDDFEIKKIRFIDSHLEINKYFSYENQWKKENIEHRSKQITEICVSIWPYFGEESTKEDESTDVTGTTPKQLFILGQSFPVQSWRDVLQQTMNTISDLEPDKFEQIIQEFPRLVGRDSKKFRAIRELNNGAYIEVNLSAQSIKRFCHQVIESVELTSDDWKVVAG